MRRALPLLLLAAGLLALAWHLAPQFDPERPAVSLSLALTFCGGWGSAVAGTALALRPQPEAMP